METKIDKTKELEANLVLMNERLLFKGTVEGNDPISIDYIPPHGDGLGYTSLELLLLSFSSCIGSGLLTFLRKMRKTILDFEIQTKGLRRLEHPTAFKTIIVTIKITSSDITEAEITKLLALLEETYCPVWTMIKGNVEVEVHSIIKRETIL
jgi:putative redox protein